MSKKNQRHLECEDGSGNVFADLKNTKLKQREIASLLGDKDPVGGGTVRLTPDHKTPHAVHPDSDPTDPEKWQALCGRHQVVKKNYWDDNTGWLNVYAIVQAASETEKRAVYEFLKQYFGDV